MGGPGVSGGRVVVGMYSGRTETSGAVATANYPARALGIRSGMSLGEAMQKASKDTVFLRADHAYYEQVSEQVMAILRGFADKFEQVSIDEASLEVTERCNEDFSKAEQLAKRLKEAIKRKEKLTCSVGIGPNKLLAKMAAGMRKPDGLTAVRPEDVDGFLEPLPVGKLYGLGPKSEGALAAIGVRTVRELKRLRLEKLTELFGEAKGRWFFNAARGMDESPVHEEPQKQLSRLCTLKKDGTSAAEVWHDLEPLVQDIAESVERFHLKFRNLGIIVVAGGEGLTRSHTLPEPTGDVAVLRREARKLLDEFFKEHPKARVRRVGARIADFAQEGAGLKRWLG